jgi:hypothetical protein
MPRSKSLIVTKESAAQSQLESAIWLWFTKEDPVSVHTLAVAAHDCYNALGAHKGKPSYIETFIKSQSKGFQKRLREAQNFFKHGLNNLTGKVKLETILADLMLAECLFCHRDLKLKTTPLMQLFWLRFLLEQPDLLFLYAPPPERLLENINTSGLNRIGRNQFLKECLPAVTKYVADKRD